MRFGNPRGGKPRVLGAHRLPNWMQKVVQAVVQAAEIVVWVMVQAFKFLMVQVS